MSIKRSDLVFAGIDDWSRFVFKHQPTGKFLCTVDRLQEAGDTMEDVQHIAATVSELYIKSPSNDFEGEPSHPIPLVD